MSSYLTPPSSPDAEEHQQQPDGSKEQPQRFKSEGDCHKIQESINDHAEEEAMNTGDERLVYLTEDGDVRVPMPAELVCPLCNDLLFDAVVIPCCGTSFCHDCVLEALSASQGSSCPADSCGAQNIHPSLLVPNKFLHRAVVNFIGETGYTRKRIRKESVDSEGRQSDSPGADDSLSRPLVIDETASSPTDSVFQKQFSPQETAPESTELFTSNTIVHQYNLDEPDHTITHQPSEISEQYYLDEPDFKRYDPLLSDQHYDLDEPEHKRIVTFYQSPSVGSVRSPSDSPDSPAGPSSDRKPNESQPESFCPPDDFCVNNDVFLFPPLSSENTNDVSSSLSGLQDNVQILRLEQTTAQEPQEEKKQKLNAYDVFLQELEKKAEESKLKQKDDKLKGKKYPSKLYMDRECSVDNVRSPLSPPHRRSRSRSVSKRSSTRSHHRSHSKSSYSRKRLNYSSSSSSSRKSHYPSHRTKRIRSYSTSPIRRPSRTGGWSSRKRLSRSRSPLSRPSRSGSLKPSSRNRRTSRYHRSRMYSPDRNNSRYRPPWKRASRFGGKMRSPKKSFRCDPYQKTRGLWQSLPDNFQQQVAQTLAFMNQAQSYCVQNDRGKLNHDNPDSVSQNATRSSHLMQNKQDAMSYNQSSICQNCSFVAKPCNDNVCGYRKPSLDCTSSGQSLRNNTVTEKQTTVFIESPASKRIDQLVLTSSNATIKCEIFLNQDKNNKQQNSDELKQQSTTTCEISFVDEPVLKARDREDECFGNDCKAVKEDERTDWEDRDDSLEGGKRRKKHKNKKKHQKRSKKNKKA